MLLLVLLRVLHVHAAQDQGRNGFDIHIIFLLPGPQSCRPFMGKLLNGFFTAAFKKLKNNNEKMNNCEKLSSESAFSFYPW